MQADSRADASFAGAFGQIVKRIDESLRKTPESALPIKMFTFGGAAMHFYTGERFSNDIDATFSHRILLPDDLEFTCRSPDGAARLLYFDRQFSNAFSLLHEDAYDESVALELTDIDSSILDVRLLSALDLAVSKISHLAGHDCDDIAALARHNLIESEALRRRAEEASKNYMGNLDRLKTSIELAAGIVADIQGKPTESI